MEELKTTIYGKDQRLQTQTDGARSQGGQMLTPAAQMNTDRPLDRLLDCYETGTGHEAEVPDSMTMVTAKIVVMNLHRLM
jgi:hypothetical protein